MNHFDWFADKKFRFFTGTLGSYIERHTGSVFVNTKSRDCSRMNRPATVPTCDLSFVPGLRGKLSRLGVMRSTHAETPSSLRCTCRVALDDWPLPRLTGRTSLIHPVLCVEHLGVT